MDCLKTDFFREKAYPTYLYFNPYKEDKSVMIDVGDRPIDLYDAVSRSFVAQNVVGQTSIRLTKDSAAVIVLAPAGGVLVQDGSKLLVNGITVDYRVGDQ